MPSAFVYDKVLKYKVQAVLQEPLHVGSTGGDPEEVLVHPVDGRPFIQASGLTGAFRDAWKKTFPDQVDSLFGSKDQDVDRGSRIVFSDGILTGSGRETDGRPAPAATELRPRVAIDAERGSVGTKHKKGTQNSSGTKFNMQYVGAGAELGFTTYIFTTDGLEDDGAYRTILGILEGNGIQFGGQKSNGCGYVQLKQVLYKAFDLRKEQGRRDWMTEDTLADRTYDDITAKIEKNTVEYAYTITVKGQTEGSLLVKALAVPDVGKDAPDAQNIQNARQEYIIPGSSLKGAVRARMTQIADYLEQHHGISGEQLINNAFGFTQSGNETGSTGTVGNLRFRDTVVGSRADNDTAELSHRIHIDKFTGGVMYGGLFSTKDVHGNLTFTIGIQNRNRPDQTLGLLLFALRDLAAGAYNLGSGYNVGKGFIAVRTIRISESGKGQTEDTVIDLEQGTVRGNTAVIDAALAGLRGGAQ